MLGNGWIRTLCSEPNLLRSIRLRVPSSTVLRSAAGGAHCMSLQFVLQFSGRRRALHVLAICPCNSHCMSLQFRTACPCNFCNLSLQFKECPGKGRVETRSENRSKFFRIEGW